MISAVFEITFMDGEKKRIEIPNCNMYTHAELWQTALTVATRIRKDDMEITRMDLIAF